MNNIITREQYIHIADTCRLLGISTYTTNNDGSINVLGDVEISGKLKDNKLPISFNKVVSSTNGLEMYRQSEFALKSFLKANNRTLFGYTKNHYYANVA